MNTENEQFLSILADDLRGAGWLLEKFSRLETGEGSIRIGYNEAGKRCQVFWHRKLGRRKEKKGKFDPQFIHRSKDICPRITQDSNPENTYT